ncbi:MULTISPECIES: hypothetical protein [unclassified Streptomyces]|uniref:hypothetical protein n=1 Tax=unclassified Streptomyces TaxID=2593676 RepID=UPI001F03F8A4|nr:MULTISPECIES: hypothetical protein [unclassified Streptomyces]MCH0563863.1 hypothetical protein [Streptomyces sp. MUM 2J]MCH0571418.1 hypothetical protein [Streptomyces sp. MUM 136J]
MAGVLALTASPASAAKHRTLTLDAGDPLAATLLEECDLLADPVRPQTPSLPATCLMTYTPAQYRTSAGPEHPVGDSVFNYGSTTVTHTLGWSDTVTSSDSFAVSSSAKSSIWKAAEIGVTATYTKTWTRSSTVSQTDSLPVPACTVGRFGRAAEMGTATGSLKLDFTMPFRPTRKSKKKYRYFVIENSTFTAPTGHGALIARSRAMTPQERTSCAS